MEQHLKTNPNVLNITVLRENLPTSDLKKEPKVLWSGTIFVKTYLVDGGIDQKLHEFLLDSSDFVRFYVQGRANYRSKPLLMSERKIDKIVKKAQSSEEPTVGKFTADQIDFKEHDIATVLSGVFRGHEGEVMEINFQTGIITLNIEFFGRITPIQVGFSECKKVI